MKGVIRRRSPLAATVVFACLAAACGEAPDQSSQTAKALPLPARADAAGYSLRPAETKAVEAFLAANRDLRVASDGDRRIPEEGEGVGSLYGVYHPYFVRGDLNDDGLLDFVLAFVRRDSSRDIPWFSVVVFTGRERPGLGPDFSPQSFLERDISLADGDIAIDRDAVLITPDLAEETTRRYRWDPARRSYVFVREGEEEPEPPPLAQT